MTFLLLSDVFGASFLPEILIHIWVLYYLVRGTVAWAKLRGAPREEPEAAAAPVVQSLYPQTDEDMTPKA